MQCDKRNTYRRKVKEEKAAAAAKDGDDASVKEGSTAEGANEHANGQTNGHVEDDEDAERPFKKFKAQNGAAVAPDGDPMDETEETIDNQDDEAEEQQDDEVDDDEQVEDEAEDEGEGEGEGEDEEGEDDDGDEIVAATGVRDEALDDPGSDSD